MTILKLQSNIEIILSILFLTAISLTSKSQILTDYDGNIYQTITIGNQTWMADNLRTTHYSDGTPIPDGREFDYYSHDTIMNDLDTTKYFFYYENDSTYANEYGCLYNWFAAVNGIKGSNLNPSNIQGVCPSGWHIPSISEWDELDNYIGENSGLLLQEGGSSGFNATLGGERQDRINNFRDINNMVAYISTTVEPDGYIRLFQLWINDSRTYRWAHSKTTGYSVRCVKDTLHISNMLTTKSDYTIILYPNPCKDYFYINSDDLKIENISIYSIQEKQVKSLIIQDDSRISVVDIDNGLYIVAISNDNSIYTKKLIIQE